MYTYQIKWLVTDENGVHHGGCAEIEADSKEHAFFRWSDIYPPQMDEDAGWTITEIIEITDNE